MRGAPIEGMTDRASLCLGLLILLGLCAPLIVPFLTRARRGAHRPARRRPGGIVATTTDPLVLLGFVDRAGPPAFDVEADPLLSWAAPAPRGLRLTDAEIEALANLSPLLAQHWADAGGPPVGDQAEAWLRENTP